ncbi:MAG: sigma-70 family RNA polymerase sigma factor [Anaerolineae bacterium]|nr:sigma-70 family RNA polymerase sigma factor [Anaerolineae bacterium]MDW8172141.1 sigma-70 family RNA polymerase sigma factor [Anaerolineae bacterium]
MFARIEAQYNSPNDSPYDVGRRRNDPPAARKQRQPRMESDPTLLRWVQATLDGDQEAFAEIVYSFTDAVYNLCYRMLSNREEAEDATQETFIRAHRALSSYDSSRPFKTWLLSIASNHCIDRIRKRRVQYLSLDDPVASEATLSLSSDEPTPEEATLDHERERLIGRLMNELPGEYRAAVVLRYWYDYSYQEIAEALSTTESAIKSRLFRARQMLADRLELLSKPARSRLQES